MVGRISISFTRGEAAVQELDKTLRNRTLFSPIELTNISSKLDTLGQEIKSPESIDQRVSLYGRVATFEVNNEIDAVVDASLELMQKKSEYSPKVLSQKVHELKMQLGHIWFNFSLSISNRRFVRLATQVLNVLEVFPSSKTADVLNIPDNLNILQAQEMLPDSELRTSIIDSESWESAELAFDLCEMAHFFYQNKINDGMKKLHLLSPSAKTELEEHCLNIDAEFPQFFLAEDVTLYRESMVRFIQALIGYANEVAQGQPLGFYLSPAEIEMMFSEVEALTAEANIEQLN